MRTAPFSSLWKEHTSLVDDEIERALSRIGAPRELREYCKSLGLYRKVSYLVTHRVDNYDARRAISSAVGMHIVGLKLLDDAADLDTAVPASLLVFGGLRLITASESAMEAINHQAPVRSMIASEMARLTAGLTTAKCSPARDFREWRCRASAYGGGFLRIYGRLAGLLMHDQRSAELAGRFSYGFGTIITIADDIVDYTKKGEREGNLGHLLLQGFAPERQIVSTLNSMAEVCRSALKGVGHEQELNEVVSQYAADVTHRILPTHMGASNR